MQLEEMEANAGVRHPAQGHNERRLFICASCWIGTVGRRAERGLGIEPVSHVAASGGVGRDELVATRKEAQTVYYSCAAMRCGDDRIVALRLYSGD